METVPLITIITVSYNAVNELEETIKSVISQNHESIEYIIIDGGSSDGTTDLLNKFNGQIFYWVSEKDCGLYYAMNKALKKSNGDWVLFLNAGDTLHNYCTIKELVKYFTDDNTTYFGRASIINKKSTYLYPDVGKDEIHKWLRKNVPNHQSMFFPRVFYHKNLYDLNYLYFSDADYKYRSKIATKYYFIDKIIVNFKLGGISSRYQNVKILARQICEVINFSKKYVGLFFAARLSLRFLMKIILQGISSLFMRCKR